MSSILAQGILWKAKPKQNRTGLFSKPQCMKAAKPIEVWDKNWQRRGKIKLEENARKDQEQDMEVNGDTILSLLRGTTEMPVSSQNHLTKKNIIQAELIRLWYLPKWKQQIRGQGPVIGILGRIVVTTTRKVTCRQLAAIMRSMVSNKPVEKLWQLQDSRKNMMPLLEEVSRAHITMERWHLMELGLNTLKRIVGKVKTYPQIVSQILGEGEDLRE